MSLRPAVEGDAEAIAAVFESSLPDPWSALMISEGLRHGCRGTVATDESGRVVGVVLVQPTPPEAEILQVAVLPEARRSGLGRALLREGLAVAVRAGAEEVFLEVRPGNAPAIAMYRSEGFEDAGLRRAYYRDGEDALVLRRALRWPLPTP